VTQDRLMTGRPVLRFAPSPNGRTHLGCKLSKSAGDLSLATRRAQDVTPDDIRGIISLLIPPFPLDRAPGFSQPQT
jgi:hypothetical protein